MLTMLLQQKSGAPEGTRTPGLLLRRQLLYPAELLAQAKRGAGDGNRTHVTSLEGWSSAIELHPPASVVRVPPRCPADPRGEVER